MGRFCLFPAQLSLQTLHQVGRITSCSRLKGTLLTCPNSGHNVPGGRNPDPGAECLRNGLGAQQMPVPGRGRGQAQDQGFTESFWNLLI